MFNALLKSKTNTFGNVSFKLSKWFDNQSNSLNKAQEMIVEMIPFFQRIYCESRKCPLKKKRLITIFLFLSPKSVYVD